MALSEEEQRLLDEMERNLYKNDVDYVATSGGPRVLDYRRLVLGVLVALAGVVVLFLGIFFQQPLIGVGGFVVMFVGVLLAFSGGKANPSHSADRRGDSQKSTASSMSWEERANHRWDVRNQR